ncbi:MAG: bifunctional (p)ppGpp synthetase/guanosine-3',5'-bis(diphosphate) 3'-pyrophosphohydrolase [Clostridia bacterium]|nr:bifunctional (p)ppGpp synthetase/guanosine-3',5'-bis(diphosphate) 3'-pyrophosphohydrolase [Clostridia bacterium]
MVVLDNDFIANVKLNYPKSANKIIDAYEFAAAAHENIKRKSGEPYIVHPLAVAKILIDNDMDYATIIAGLLHDVVEDTPYTVEDMKKKFGATVAKLVDGVTKINSLDYSDMAQNEADSMKRLIIAMGNDIRVIFIKLADRLHNMRTIEFLSPEKQRKMAIETKEIFIPIAEIIGLRKVRSELQNLVLKCLEPEVYNKIKVEFDAKYAKKDKKVKELQSNIVDILKKQGIVCSSITAWPEHYYSIYKKLNSQGIGKVYGLILFRIVVPTEMDCYKTLGIIQKNFNPLPNQIQDYIASPKPNGYKSLQSTLVLPDTNITFKVMIRTPEMDKICEYGISAHWLDKDTDVKFDKSYESYNKLKEIVMNENSEFHNSTSFINAIKNDLNVSTTWVFTPKLKPICLNIAKPTVIDFAYALHTDIGHNAVGAVINGKRVPLKTELVSGDVVNVLVSEEDKAPSRTWLSVAKTTLAKKRIREYINKHMVSKFVKKGKDILSKELKEIGHELGDLVNKFDEIQKEYNFLSLEDMFASVGYNSITSEQLVNFVKEDDAATACVKTAPVIVDGSSRFSSVIFPRCCSAVPGDDIVAVLSKNKVAIHTCTCKNIESMEPDSVLKAVWKKDIKQKFNVNVKVVAKDKVGFASELFGTISKLNMNITKITALLPNEEECELDVSVSVKNKQELDVLMSAIAKIHGVKQVLRSYNV